MEFTPGARVLVVAGDAYKIVAYSADQNFNLNCTPVQKTLNAYDSGELGRAKSFSMINLEGNIIRILTLTNINSPSKIGSLNLDLSQHLVENEPSSSKCISNFGENYCIKCDFGYKLISSNVGGYCVEIIEDIDGYFDGGNNSDIRNKIFYSNIDPCIQKIPGCLRCDSGDNQKCNKCQTGFKLENLKCLRECPSGTFRNGEYGCAKCQNNCLSCDPVTLSCISCKDTEPFFISETLGCDTSCGEG